MPLESANQPDGPDLRPDRVRLDLVRSFLVSQQASRIGRGAPVPSREPQVRLTAAPAPKRPA